MRTVDHGVDKISLEREEREPDSEEFRTIPHIGVRATHREHIYKIQWPGGSWAGRKISKAT